MTFDPDQETRSVELPRARRAIGWRDVLATFAEIALVFGVFAAYGAWPVPDVNEQYYVGKAIHFWNKEWLANDPFLNSPDSHWLFYAVFGLLSFAFKQNALVWVGRSIVWATTACAWVRLSRVLVPRRWASVLTAAAFAFYLESFHLAGEWIFGGVEGKGFAFPFVFWGLACFLEGRYNRAWILMGIGSAFHALVGGWAVLASLFAWTIDSLRAKDGENGLGARLKKLARSFRATALGLFAGGAISLLGVVPALRLDAGASAEVIRESRQIYVFERLAHHLVASSLPWTFLTRFVLLVAAFALTVALASVSRRAFERWSGEERGGAREERSRFARLGAFVSGALLFALIGATIDWGSKYLESIGALSDAKTSASLLRYYWYRLSDWAVPFGLVFFGADAARTTFALVRDRVQKSRFSFSALAPNILFQLAFAFVLYWAFRTAFYAHACAAAKASAIDGLIPLPKPTECVSYLAALVLFGALLLSVFAFASKRRAGDDARANVSLLSGAALWLSFALCLAPCWRLATFVDLRGTKVIPRSAPPKESIADGWIDVCHWVRANVSQEAIFLTPRGCDSFKWEAQRAEAGSWKECPQDAKSIVRWSRKMERFYANPGAKEDSPERWNQPLVVVFLNKGRDRVLAESERYGYDYAIVEAPPYTVAAVPEALRRWKEFEENDLVYQNDQFVVLKLKK